MKLKKMNNQFFTLQYYYFCRCGKSNSVKTFYMTAEVKYLGELRCDLLHLFSGTHIHTDAPLDNEGKAESFSPTDLVATAVGACMMTVMGIKARDMKVSLEGTKIEVLKV